MYSLNPAAFHLQTEKMRRIRTNSIYDGTALADTCICAIRTVFWGVDSIAQLVEVTDSVVLSGVVEVVISNPTVGHKIFFSILPAYLILISPYQSSL